MQKAYSLRSESRRRCGRMMDNCWQATYDEWHSSGEELMSSPSRVPESQSPPIEMRQLMALPVENDPMHKDEDEELQEVEKQERE